MRFHLDSVLSTQKICSNAVPWLNDNRELEIVASISVLLALATVAVVLRVFARRTSKLKFGVDDWLIGVALVSNTMFTENIEVLMGVKAVFICYGHGSVHW